MVCDKVRATTEGRERQVVLGVGRRHGGVSLWNTGMMDEEYNRTKELEKGKSSAKMASALRRI